MRRLLSIIFLLLTTNSFAYQMPVTFWFIYAPATPPSTPQVPSQNDYINIQNFLCEINYKFQNNYDYQQSSAPHTPVNTHFFTKSVKYGYATGSTASAVFTNFTSNYPGDPKSLNIYIHNSFTQPAHSSTSTVASIRLDNLGGGPISVHEIGHALGLSHNLLVQSYMWSNGIGSFFTSSEVATMQNTLSNAGWGFQLTNYSTITPTAHIDANGQASFTFPTSSTCNAFSNPSKVDIKIHTPWCASKPYSIQTVTNFYTSYNVRHYFSHTYKPYKVEFLYYYGSWYYTSQSYEVYYTPPSPYYTLESCDGTPGGGGSRLAVQGDSVSFNIIDNAPGKSEILLESYGNKRAKVVNISGQMLLNVPLNDGINSVDISKLSTGFYFLIIDDYFKSTHKFFR